MNSHFDLYLHAHDLHAIFSDILTSLYYYRMDEPLPYIISILQHIHDPCNHANPKPYYLATPKMPKAVLKTKNYFFQSLSS